MNQKPNHGSQGTIGLVVIRVDLVFPTLPYDLGHPAHLEGEDERDHVLDLHTALHLVVQLGPVVPGVIGHACVIESGVPSNDNVTYWNVWSGQTF